jgi:hypothetical protein
MSIFGVQTTDAKPEKKPTIAQFIKQTKRPKNNVRSVVNVVWLPGKFDNFTLQTDRFRVIITPKHVFYGGLQEFFANSSTAETPIGIEITDWDKGAYMLYEPKERGMWQELGDSGYRWARDE